MEDKVMKTMNSRSTKNEMRSLTLAIILIAALLSVNVNGAELRGKTKSTIKMTELNSYLVAEKEAALELEDWMINNKYFLNLNLEEEAELPIEMESWMTNSEYFEASISLESEIEKALCIEEWMMNDSLFSTSTKVTEEVNADVKAEELAMTKPAPRKKVIGVTFNENQFGRRTFIIIEEDDSKLHLEQWMFDVRHWRK